MPKIIVDQQILEKLLKFTEPVELCDDRGRTLGYFQPAEELMSGQEPRIKSPLSDEEIERRLHDKTGRPLADILRDLGAA